MVAVTAAILIDDNRILIARRPSDDRLAGLWEFPGGKLETGETPRDCLRRELWEEFGIRTRIGPFFDETEYHYDHLSIRLLVYQAEIESGQLRPRVHDAVRWVTPEQMSSFRFAPADRPIVTRLQIDREWMQPRP